HAAAKMSLSFMAVVHFTVRERRVIGDDGRFPFRPATGLFGGETVLRSADHRTVWGKRYKGRKGLPQRAPAVLSTLCYNVTSRTATDAERNPAMIEALKRTFRSLCGAALAAALFGLATTVPAPAADKVSVVAAENIYGDIAAQIGGAHVAVTSLISNPSQDPHLFEASPSAVRAIAGARIVILNGADYDPWMEK